MSVFGVILAHIFRHSDQNNSNTNTFYAVKRMHFFRLYINVIKTVTLPIYKKHYLSVLSQGIKSKYNFWVYVTTKKHVRLYSEKTCKFVFLSAHQNSNDRSNFSENLKLAKPIPVFQKAKWIRRRTLLSCKLTLPCVEDIWKIVYGLLRTSLFESNFSLSWLV